MRRLKEIYLIKRLLPVGLASMDSKKFYTLVATFEAWDIVVCFIKYETDQSLDKFSFV